MKIRKLKKRIKCGNALMEVINNAHDVAVAKDVFSMLSVQLGGNTNIDIRENPFVDEELNCWFWFVCSRIKELKLIAKIQKQAECPKQGK